MSKFSATKTSRRSAASGSYKAVGTMPDGVVILAPKSKPDSFTMTQLKRAIETVHRSTASGKVSESAKGQS
jgi:hypothetical protein